LRSANARLRTGVAAVAAVVTLSASLVCADWKAGVARLNITPKGPMWLSGYGDRDHPAEGKLTDLWAKALVLEDSAGRRAALVTLDLVGIGRDVSEPVCQALAEKYGLERSQIALCSSHTHTGPVVGHNLASMYFLDETQEKLVDDYTARLGEDLVSVVGQAIQDLAECRIAWGQGTADFAVNRRNNPEPSVPDLRAANQLKGPVDHDVPVLKVTDAEGRLKAIVFGYACHATVLAFYQWSGDYPGFAQLHLEAAHPGVTALFFAGCGADQNPLPRRTVELAEQYGRRLAAAVEAVLAGDMAPVEGDLATTYTELDLPLDKLPSREQLEEDAASDNRYVAKRAKLLLARIEGGAPLSPSYPYPVQVWRLGPDLLWVTLGGEVVVDFSLRLKQELGPGTWVAGYANDVMAYIPSKRVLLEGGYEGGGAMVYYGLPSPWAPQVEDMIVSAVHDGVDALRP
jgi:neutral ceramidase